MKNILINFLIGLSIFLFKPQWSDAQWVQTNGPYGGSICALGLNGTNLFAASFSGNVFLSTNNGTTWTKADSGLPQNSQIISFAGSGTYLFAATSTEVFLTTDNGTSWRMLNDGFPTYANITSLAVSGDLIFAGTDHGVFRSDNNGAAWIKIDSGLTDTNITALVVSGTAIFAGASYYGSNSGLGGIFRSMDNGNNWTSVNSWIPDSMGRTVDAIVANGSSLFAVIHNTGIYRSTNNGNSWSSVNSGLPADASVLYLSAVGGNLYACPQGYGLYISKNNGTKWSQVNTEVTGSLVGYGNKVFNGSVYLSIDSGATWSEVNNGMINSTVGGFATIGEDIFTFTDGGIFHSANNGLTWDYADFGLPTYYGFISLINLGNNLFALNSINEIFLSSNKGKSWSKVNINIDSFETCGLVASQGNLFAFAEEIYSSSDTGKTWSIITEPLGQTSSPYFAVKDSSIWLYYYENSIFYSNNLGKSWTAIRSENPGFISMLQATDSYLFAISDAGIIRSSNKGKNWTFASSGLPAGVVIDAFFASGFSLYIGTDKGIFLSADSGNSWNSLSAGLPSQEISAIAQTNADLYVGVGFAGVWRLPRISVAVKYQQIRKSDVSSFKIGVQGPYASIVTATVVLPNSEKFNVTVYNSCGRLIASLADRCLSAGMHRFLWDTKNIPAGRYLMRMQTSAGSIIKNISLFH